MYASLVQVFDGYLKCDLVCSYNDHAHLVKWRFSFTLRCRSWWQF